MENEQNENTVTDMNSTAPSEQKIRSGQTYLYRKNGYNSTVFEIRMKDEVETGDLDAALRKTTLRFPYLTQKLVEKDGSYYLYPDPVALRAVHTAQLRQLGSKETGYHMIDVTAVGTYIRVAFHHALCDGRGIKPFIETLVYYYCTIHYARSFSTEEIRTAEDFPDRTECSEPFGTELLPVDKKNTTTPVSDGYALPESTAEPVVCCRTELTVSEEQFVRTAKANGASPAIFAAILISRAIFHLHSDAGKPIVCSMAADLRGAVGMEKTHRNCTGSYYLPYGATNAENGTAELAFLYRKLLGEQRTQDSQKELLNKQIQFFNKVDSLVTLEEKQQAFSFFDKMCINTYVLSYPGRMQFNDFADFVDSVHLYSDKIKGLSVNMVAAGSTIAFDVLQGFETDVYAKAFSEELTKANIEYCMSRTFPFTTGADMSHITASHQPERYSA